MLSVDVPAILPIEQSAYDFPWSEGVISDCLTANYSNWVLEDSAQNIIGYTFVAFAADEGHILNLTVSPAMRRKGMGQLLLNHILAVSRRNLTGRLILEVRPSNPAGIGLYERNDFHQIGRRKEYYPAAEGREDALVLARMIDTRAVISRT